MAQLPTPAPAPQRSADPDALFHIGAGRPSSVSVFDPPRPDAPRIDPHYLFPPQATRLVLYALEHNRKLWISGPTGCGKSSLVEQVCARLGYGLLRINADSQLTRRDLIGGYITRGTEIVFQYGIVPRALQAPVVLLIDEIDALDPETAMVLYRLLEEQSAFVVLEHEGEPLPAHPQFRLVATANTRGSGDELGEYLGTRIQSRAFLDRFQLFINLDFLPQEEEVALLLRRLPALGDRATSLVRWAQAVREGHRQGRLTSTLSTRTLLTIGGMGLDLEDLALAVQAGFAARLTPLEQEVVGELTRRFLGDL